MDIKESNKLIAEFMGYTYYPATEWYNFERVESEKVRYVLSDLMYNSSWNNLMPVVEKIDSLCPIQGYTKNAFIFKTQHYNAIFENCFIDKNTIVALGDSKIDAVWKAVVEFIKKYNE